MSETRSPADPPTSLSHRALVLGGGGALGNAWLIGVLAGLAESGVDVTDADLVVGTSAGATAAAQLAGAPVADLYATIRDAEPLGPPGPARTPPSSAGAVADQLDRTSRIIGSSSDAADMRRRMGAAALELDPASDLERSRRWRETVAARLPAIEWPERRLLITAIDARTGAPVVFDRNSGIDLADAVAASTSSGAPYAIGDERYLDGGYRRNENADLAEGCGRVVVLSPFGGRTRHPRSWGMQLAAQVDELVAAGSRVEAIYPDAASSEAFGPNMMDISRRASAAKAGHAQGQSAATAIAALWR